MVTIEKMIEIAVSAAVSWLWTELGKRAELKDKENAIKKALKASFQESYQKFYDKYDDFSEIYFNQEFLNKYVFPEIFSLLTRTQQPKIKSISDALPVNALLELKNNTQNVVEEFFYMVMDSMKKHTVLQNIINNRQTEETNQIVKDLKEEQESFKKSLENSLDEIKIGVKKEDENQGLLISSNKSIEQKLSQVMDLLQVVDLPESKNDGLNKLLTEQLDRIRDYINSNHVKEAYDLLKSLEEAVKESDDYTRFRWHTNLAACYIANNERQRASEEYFFAYNFAKNEEKAISNRIRAFLLIDKFNDGLFESEKALKEFTNSGSIWALYINSKQYLNQEFDESELPENLKEDVSVLLSLSHYKINQKEYLQAFELVKKANELSHDSFEVKRTLLSHALLWSSIDSIKLYYKQLLSCQFDALKYAVNSFGNIVEILKNIHAQHIFTEVAHNYATACETLGQDDLKKDVVTYAFSVYPKEPTFLWYKIKELKRINDLVSIRKITDEELETFDKTLLFSLAEISANNGLVEWNEKLINLLNKQALNEKESNELVGLELCATWKAGDTKKALHLANEKLEIINSYPPLKTLYIRMLHESGNLEERDRLIKCSDSDLI